MASPSNANSLRQGSTGTGATATGALPGAVLWTYYQTFESFGQFCPPGPAGPGQPGPGPFEDEDILCNNEGEGDNIIRLVNPNGAANGNLAGAKEQTVCAMIYMFDDDQEMGECCGCPLSSTQLATFSVNHNLTSNWGLISPEPGTVLSEDNALGAIAVVAAGTNALPTCLGQSGACNGGCDPTNVPGYSVTTANNLLGSITHNQSVQTGSIGNQNFVPTLTEIAFSDDAGGDPTNLIYLQNQCGALVGNSSGGGICNCPIE